MPGNDEGPRRREDHQGPDDSAGNAGLSVRHPAPIVPAPAYGPDGRRTRWLTVLEVCPSCERPHLFFGTPARPARLRSCGGKVFQLHAVFGGKSEPPEVAR